MNHFKTDRNRVKQLGDVNHTLGFVPKSFIESKNFKTTCYLFKASNYNVR